MLVVNYMLYYHSAIRLPLTLFETGNCEEGKKGRMGTNLESSLKMGRNTLIETFYNYNPNVIL